jgi:aminoglycoside phosphotransferase (APT) family kinase protein
VQIAELVDVDRLTPALVKATGDDRWRDATLELISGGKSNLTFFVRSDAGELVLRRPPTGELLPSAHWPTAQSRSPPSSWSTPATCSGFPAT